MNCQYNVIEMLSQATVSTNTTKNESKTAVHRATLTDDRL